MDWPLLEGVPEAERRQILKVARRRRFARSEVVCHQGDPADSCHLIVSGRFAVRIMTPLGDTVTIAVRGPGTAFGEMALLVDDGRRTATVAALEKGETFSLHRGDFETIRKTYPGADRFLWNFVVGEIRMLNERLLEALYLPVDRRVRRRLVEMADLYRSDTAGRIIIPLTQEVISELAGATRPTVNQVLREEEKAGLIELGRGRTVVLDLEALRKRAR